MEGSLAAEADAVARCGGADSAVLSGTGEDEKGEGERKENVKADRKREEKRAEESRDAGQGPSRDSGAVEGGGDLVISYEDFLSYLAKKHPGVRQTCLGFKGRNAVLYLFDYGDGGGDDDNAVQPLMGH